MQPQPGYPYGPNPYAPGAMGPAPATDAIAGAAKPALALIGLRAALPLITYVVPLYRMFPPEMARAGMDGVKSLLGLAALIAYFVWFAKYYGWVRAARGGTKYSTGMAIGGWFIPFANFVLPYLALRDAVRRGANDEGGGLVALWWASYLVLTMLTMTESVLIQTHAHFGSVETMNLLLRLMYWGQFLLTVTSWGSLAYIVQRTTKLATGR